MCTFIVYNIGAFTVLIRKNLGSFRKRCCDNKLISCITTTVFFIFNSSHSAQISVHYSLESWFKAAFMAINMHICKGGGHSNGKYTFATTVSPTSVSSSICVVM